MKNKKPIRILCRQVHTKAAKCVPATTLNEA